MKVSGKPHKERGKLKTKSIQTKNKQTPNKTHDQLVRFSSTVYNINSEGKSMIVTVSYVSITIFERNIICAIKLLHP